MFTIFFLEIEFASNYVWNEISQLLDNRMSAKAIHTFVFEGRYSIHEKLGILSVPKPMSETNVLSRVLNDNGEIG